MKEEADLNFQEDHGEHDKKLWKDIWALNSPNKVKHFIWRTCRNELPTKENLVHRTVINDPICDRNLVTLKTILHSLWSCFNLDIMWENSEFKGLRWSSHFLDFKELMAWLIASDQSLDFLFYDDSMVNLDIEEPNQIKPAQQQH